MSLITLMAGNFWKLFLDCENMLVTFRTYIYLENAGHDCCKNIRIFVSSAGLILFLKDIIIIN